MARLAFVPGFLREPLEDMVLPIIGFAEAALCRIQSVASVCGGHDGGEKERLDIWGNTGIGSGASLVGRWMETNLPAQDQRHEVSTCGFAAFRQRLRFAVRCQQKQMCSDCRPANGRIGSHRIPRIDCRVAQFTWHLISPPLGFRWTTLGFVTPRYNNVEDRKGARMSSFWGTILAGTAGRL